MMLHLLTCTVLFLKVSEQNTMTYLCLPKADNHMQLVIAEDTSETCKTVSYNKSSREICTGTRIVNFLDNVAHASLVAKERNEAYACGTAPVDASCDECSLTFSVLQRWILERVLWTRWWLLQGLGKRVWAMHMELKLVWEKSVKKIWLQWGTALKRKQHLTWIDPSRERLRLHKTPRPLLD